jgi:hypothetical protein
MGGSYDDGDMQKLKCFVTQSEKESSSEDDILL